MWPRQPRLESGMEQKKKYNVISGLGLVGYDDCFTRSRSRVRFSEPVKIAIDFFTGFLFIKNVNKTALLVQWLEYLVANEVARVRFPDGANFFWFFFFSPSRHTQIYSKIKKKILHILSSI